MMYVASLNVKRKFFYLEIESTSQKQQKCLRIFSDVMDQRARSFECGSSDFSLHSLVQQLFTKTHTSASIFTCTNPDKVDGSNMCAVRVSPAIQFYYADCKSDGIGHAR